jgi:hypothetical protein
MAQWALIRFPSFNLYLNQRFGMNSKVDLSGVPINQYPNSAHISASFPNRRHHFLDGAAGSDYVFDD